jgi:hypothetical protein
MDTLKITYMIKNYSFEALLVGNSVKLEKMDELVFYDNINNKRIDKPDEIWFIYPFVTLTL